MEVESVCNINPFLEVLTCPIVQENWSCLVVFNDTIMSNTSNNLRTAIDELLDVVGVDSFDEVKQCGHTLNLNVTDGAATLVTVPVQDQGLSSMFYIVLVAGVVYIVHVVFTGYMNREKEEMDRRALAEKEDKDRRALAEKEDKEIMERCRNLEFLLKDNIRGAVTQEDYAKLLLAAMAKGNIEESDVVVDDSASESTSKSSKSV